jgi:hypothetical protein
VADLIGLYRCLEKPYPTYTAGPIKITLFFESLRGSPISSKIEFVVVNDIAESYLKDISILLTDEEFGWSTLRIDDFIVGKRKVTLVINDRNVSDSLDFFINNRVLTM